MAITTTEAAQIKKLVAAMFNLAPSAAIYNDMVTSFEAGGNSLSLLATNLSASGVYQNQLSGLDTAGLANKLMTSLGLTVGTTAGDAAYDYFTGRLNAGVTLDQVAVEAVTYLADDSRRNAAFDTTVTLLNNKVTVIDALIDSAIVAATTADLDFIDTVTADTATVDTATAAIEVQAQIDPATATYTVAAASTSVTEGNGVVFTVTANGNLSAETTVNYQIQGVEVAGGTATPVADLGVLNGTVTIPAGASSATFTITPTADQVTEGYEGFKVVLLDSSFAEIASSSNVVISDPANAGQTFMLTESLTNNSSSLYDSSLSSSYSSNIISNSQCSCER